MKAREFLIISPHIDDEVISCGGIVDSRFHVHFLGVEEFRIISKQERLKEANNAALFLGYQYTICNDNQVNDYRLYDLIGQIESIINEIRPETIFIPSSSFNQDHRNAHNASLAALRHHDKNFFTPNVLVYESIGDLLWPYETEKDAFNPNIFVPINIERKLKAYRCHKSQVRNMRSPKKIRLQAQFRGMQANVQYAEAFRALRVLAPQYLMLGLNAR